MLGNVPGCAQHEPPATCVHKYRPSVAVRTPKLAIKALLPISACCACRPGLGQLLLRAGEQVAASASFPDAYPQTCTKQRAPAGPLGGDRLQPIIIECILRAGRVCRQGLGQLLLRAGEQVAASAGFSDAYVQACTKQRAPAGPLGGNRLQPYSAATDMYRRAGCAHAAAGLYCLAD